MTAFAAYLTSTLHVFNANLQAKREEGQTTVEYLGLCALIIAVFAGVTAIASAFTGGLTEVINAVFDAVLGWI